MLCLLAATAFASLVAAQGEAPTEFCTPRLGEIRVPHNNIPFQVSPVAQTNRGAQSGYNICNSTTLGPTSLCQTAYINGADDFCLWGPQVLAEPIGNIEGEMVAYCTKPRWGTRLIPAGAITGLTFVRTPDYIQVTGRIRQDQINILADDEGGEMDPWGADSCGNPIGSLVYTNAQGTLVDGFAQTTWHNFMGANTFCFKACDLSRPNALRLCEHIFDRVGCSFNAPADYTEGVFESCEGESQDPPGIYTGSNGQVSTYTQPPEGTVITSLPFVPRKPASSSCTSFQSAQLFADIASVSGPRSSSSASASASTSRSSGAAQPTSAPAGPGAARPPTAASSRSSSAPPTGAATAPLVPAAGLLFALLAALLLI